MQLINNIKDFFSRLFGSNNGPEVQPITIFDASTIRRIEDDDRYINPNRINSSFDLMNFDRIRELEKELHETKRECKQNFEETKRRVDQINQRVDDLEININRNTKDINRLTKLMETLAVNTQNHEEKMVKYDELIKQQKKMIEDDRIRIEKLEQSLANDKIRINKQDHWMKEYAKDAFSNKKENTNNKNINKEKDYDQGTMTRSSTKKTFPKMDKSYNKDILN